ncbi:MAG: rhomboid family intramembrane serine protease, partial [Bacteroidota bacterium]
MAGSPNSVVGLVLLFLTAAATYKGFRDWQYQDRYAFQVDGILLGKEYDRLLTSGFLHVGWLHFSFNMVALMSFCWSLEMMLGPWKLLLLYFASLLGGSLLALYLHRQHGDYSAVGASGAISGVIFASIVLFPGQDIGFILLPVYIPAWLFGLLFIIVSIFGIKSQADNIGHEAHLGGAITGVLVAIIIQPGVLKTNLFTILGILLPVTAFLLLIVRNPAVLMIDGYWGESLKKGGDWFRQTRDRHDQVLSE